MFPGVVPQLKGHFVLLHQGGVALQTSLFHELYSLVSTPDHSFHWVLAKAKYLPFFQVQLGREGWNPPALKCELVKTELCSKADVSSAPRTTALVHHPHQVWEAETS